MSNRRTVLIAAGLSLAYLAIQLAYISRLPLVMDEFDGAQEAWQLLSVTPYKDFRPYKTVLGYYLELPPLLVTSDVWTGLMLTKAWIAVINTAAIFAATVTLASLFTPLAALTGQVLLISVTTFLERSSEIRVDMLTAWAGLASFLLLLNRRWLLAGVMAGVSFLISQKGVYYALAANTAAGAFWLFESRDRRTFRDLIVMNAGSAAVIAVYILLWGIASSPSTVFNATFLSHGDIVLSNMYDLEEHWARTLGRNPLFYWGALAGIVALIVLRWRGQVGASHAMVAVYAGVVFALCRWHKQPWPYFFVILIPTLMVVHVAVVEYLARYQRWRPIAAAVILLLGVAFPLWYMPGILERDNGYQQHVIRLASSMLAEGETYLAGNDLIYNRHQSHPALRRLGAPRLQALQQWSPEQLQKVIAELEEARPKFVIDEYRMRGLPEPLRAYLATRFKSLWSSVHGYAPLVDPGQADFDVWFDGDYTVEGDAVIDGRAVSTGTTIALTRGKHRHESAVPVRLQFKPAGFAAHADPIRKSRRPMFARAYDY